MGSGVERGAERIVHERDTQSCGALFFGPVSVKVDSWKINWSSYPKLIKSADLGYNQPQEWSILNPSDATRDKSPLRETDRNYWRAEQNQRWIPLGENMLDSIDDRWTMTYRCSETEPPGPPVPTTPIPRPNCPESAIHVAVQDETSPKLSLFDDVEIDGLYLRRSMAKLRNGFPQYQPGFQK